MRDKIEPTIRVGKHKGKPRCQEMYPTPGLAMHFSQCSEPVKEGAATAQGEPICARHDAMYRRRRERSEAYETADRAREERERSTKARLSRINAALGANTARGYYVIPLRGSALGTYSPNEALVSFEFLERLVAEKETGRE